MKKTLIVVVAAIAAVALLPGCTRGPKDGEHTLRILTTNDVHGTYFDSTYVSDRTRPSLLSVNYYVDSVRTAAGRDNVLLIDAGDFLQGDNAAYYYNYVDTITPHVYPRIAAYMGYDAITVGNHDVETGHPVYDRITKDLHSAGIPFLGGNAIRDDSGQPYYDLYKTFNRAGLKVLVIGYTNANITAWLGESVWSGMTFESLIPLVQQDVDRLVAKEQPQVVIVSVHSGTGPGDGSQLESQGRDLYNSLSGVDFVICSHDHRAYVASNDHIGLINSGSHSRDIGYGEITVTTRKGQIESKTISTGLIHVDKDKSDPEMRAAFQKDYEAVKAFTLKPVGTLTQDMVLADAVKGMSPYTNFMHYISLCSSGADISIAAPLSLRGTVKAGTLIFNDMFSLYSYENQLNVITMTGEEVRRYLEASYDAWVNTVSSPASHVLKIQNRPDPRSGTDRWSFAARTYNFDSAGGLNYTVDVTKPLGKRVSITTMANGAAFDPTATYSVALTSYRANGGGGLLKAAGVDSDNIEERIIGKYPEIRNLMYDYISECGVLDVDEISRPDIIGHWSFVPESYAPAIARDAALVR